MKLVTFAYNGKTTLGAIADNSVVDLKRAYEAWSTQHAATATNFPTCLLAFLQANDTIWNVTNDVLAWVQSGTPSSIQPAVVRSLSEVRILPLLTNPSKIICVGLNYHDHCREQDVDVPETPMIFAKFPSSIIGPDEEITWPAEASTQVDYEVELAVMIRREARNVSAEDADHYIGGYTILNDISARDVQFADGQWVRGKSFDTFCPIGPYLVTPDEIDDPHDLAIRCWLNGELLQDSSTAELIFKIPYLIEYLSKTCTLLPGDIISTGTPSGVGVFRDPPIFLKSGDVVELEIDRLGRLRNSVA